MQKEFNQVPIQKIQAVHKEIHCFNTQVESANIDPIVVNYFGEEWKKFNNFSDAEINKIGDMYFDIIDEHIINKNTYGIDIGCGTGRWTKYLIDKIGFMEAIDPSDAIFVADQLIGEQQNVRFSQASTDNIPFDDETFDFGMSVGVLHHIPNTQKAMTDSVKKIKIGDYFYVYLYYDLENKGFIFKAILSIVTMIRRFISSLPHRFNKPLCDLIALFIYMPIILFGRMLKFIGFTNFADKLPLSPYQNQSFFIIGNDALDRFGTSLEQRFSRHEITRMMEEAGLSQITIADTLPYWHAIGKRIK